MGVNLSIKNVPEEEVESLRRRAQQNHRSLQGELRAIIEAAAKHPSRPISIDELAELGRKRGLSMPSESARIVRESRDR
jgi:plasmid stability protein